MLYSSQIILAAILAVLLFASIVALISRDSSAAPNLGPVTLSERERDLLQAASEMKRRQKSEKRTASSPAEREKLRRRAGRTSRKKAEQEPSPPSDSPA